VVEGQRALSGADRVLLVDRLRRSWSAWQAQGGDADDAGARLMSLLPSLIPSFGPWQRAGRGIDAAPSRATAILYRHRESDEYLLLMVPAAAPMGVPVTVENLVEVITAATQDAVAGDFLRVWESVLDAALPVPAVAELFLHRLPQMSPDVQFLAAFTLVPRTHALLAYTVRAAMTPTRGLMRAQVDQVFWENSTTSREAITDWLVEEIERFVASVPDAAVVEDDDYLRSEVDNLTEAFLDAQYAHDRTGMDRVSFRWR
jgi:hypothetical protein